MNTIHDSENQIISEVKNPFFSNEVRSIWKFCLLKRLQTDQAPISLDSLCDYAVNIEQVRADLVQAAEASLGDDPLENEMIELAQQFLETMPRRVKAIIQVTSSSERV